MQRSLDLVGRTIPRVGYGAMQLERAADAPGILRAAVDAGVRLIDTAGFYAEGAVDRAIREALHPYGDDLVIATKVGARPHPQTRLTPAQKPHELREDVEDDLARLGLETLPIVHLRRVDRRPGIVAEGDQLVPLDDQLAELVALRDAGKIDGIGLSHVTAEQIRTAASVGIVSVQNADNLLVRDDDARAAAREAGAAWMPFFPLGSGFPGQRRVSDEPEVVAIARELGATPGQVGLAWLLDRDASTLLIPGTTSPQHLAENVAAIDVVFTDDQRQRLDALA